MKYLFIILSLSFISIQAQKLPNRWDELVASDWENALKQSNYTCILPIGILEKHGPHVPMGSDLIRAREWAIRASQIEYAVIFPDYFYGQINEARHEYGTFSLPAKIAWDLLEATCDEIGRNGFKRIVIINGHGGNPQMIRYFIQTRLEKRRDYAVYFFDPYATKDDNEKIQKLHKSDIKGDMHAGENETSAILHIRPDLVKLDSANNESGADLKRLQLPSDIYTAIWWYASFPHHYAGEGDKGTKELGKVLTDSKVNALVKVLKTIKADEKTLQLQNEFFDKVKK